VVTGLGSWLGLGGDPFDLLGELGLGWASSSSDPKTRDFLIYFFTNLQKYIVISKCCKTVPMPPNRHFK
jgi:hypothetical protein